MLCLLILGHLAGQWALATEGPDHIQEKCTYKSMPMFLEITKLVFLTVWLVFTDHQVGINKFSVSVYKSKKCQLLSALEGMAQLLAPAEGFGLRPRHF